MATEMAAATVMVSKRMCERMCCGPSTFPLFSRRLRYLFGVSNGLQLVGTFDFY